MQRALMLPMRVWDAPIRLFHWLIVVLLATSWFTQWRGWMQLHLLSGYTILTLLIFRLVWGFVGSDTARFRAFLKSPLAGLRHLSQITRKEPDTQIGHNAAGGWMVLVLLLALAVQVGTGLCANDDLLIEGPLARHVGKPLSDELSRVHQFNFNVVLALIVLHVVAVAAYAVLKHQNLLKPMITGKKRLPAATRAPRMRSPVLASAVLIGAAAIAAVVANL